MVGKIKHVRQKLHQEAVKLERPRGLCASPGSEASPLPVLGGPPPSLENRHRHKQVLTESSFPSGVFAGTKIPAEALVQTLKCEESPDVPVPPKAGPEEKRLKSKKEKMKERRERWLNKISSIKQQQEQQVAEARRQATPVVGDLRPLADALPELCQLIGPPATATLAVRRKSRKSKVPVKRPDPTDFSQMKQSQKRKFLETESSRFVEAAKTLSGRINPLADIGEQLKKRMRQEEEQGGS
ncbi:LOW QUALITY PROTEIN: ribosome biogenesis protein SLX9 homolog [Echeneis naucrates]|uniref:LOW QUALITY PROTEIN: ribosome biogenesis protein SLX9 homolog n=1 Tax=Echeneis naucrates TaxID=173247 RepID=UPI0011132D05|nr:LOW QUALITY PROTEIN: protein FAM207A [Echeneis naucrates]